MGIEEVKKIVQELKKKYPNTLFQINYTPEDNDYTVLMSDYKIQHSKWFIEFLGRKIQEYFSKGKEFNTFFCYDSRLEKMED